MEISRTFSSDQKIIFYQKLFFDTSQDSEKIIQTGTGKFFINKFNNEVLVKDGEFLPGADGFALPSQQPRRKYGEQSSGGAGQPGSGGSGSSDSGSIGSDSCPSNLTPKSSPEIIKHWQGFDDQPRTQREKKLSKMHEELKQSEKEERLLNDKRKKAKKALITLIIKDDMRFFAPHPKLREKFHHHDDLGVTLPETLPLEEVKRLANPNLYKERLKIFRNPEILPGPVVKEYGKKLRLHMLDPYTEMIRGTFGVNLEARGVSERIEGYHFYNPKTGYNCFFDAASRQYKTGFTINNKQKLDLLENKNML